MNHSQASAGKEPAASLAPISSALLNVFGALQELSPQIRESVERQMTRRGGNLQLRIPHHQIAFGPLANRHKDAFRDEDFESLKDGIEASRGNEVPIIVRPIIGPNAHQIMDDGVLYEVVAGHRRLRACQALGLDVKAILVPEMSDKEAARLMQAENAERKSLSPYEAGAMYQNWLDQKIYANQNELARDNNISASEVSRALAIARLPKPILESFASPRDLQYKDAESINNLLRKAESDVLAVAKKLASQERKLSRTKVLVELEAAVVPDGGIGSANASSKQPFQVAGNAIGGVSWDARGCLRIRVGKPLEEAAKAKLQKLLQEFFEKESRAVKKSKTVPRHS